MRFDRDRYAANQRQLAALMGQYHLRYLRRLAAAFDGDLALPLILGEVAHRNIAPLFNETGATRPKSDEELKAAREEGRLSQCNAISTSLATGFPRETVRRKLKKLVDSGILAQSPGGGYVITAKPLEHYADTLNQELLIDFLATAEDIRALMDEAI